MSRVFAANYRANNEWFAETVALSVDCYADILQVPSSLPVIVISSRAAKYSRRYCDNQPGKMIYTNCWCNSGGVESRWLRAFAYRNLLRCTLRESLEHLIWGQIKIKGLCKRRHWMRPKQCQDVLRRGSWCRTLCAKDKYRTKQLCKPRAVLHMEKMCKSQTKRCQINTMT